MSASERLRELESMEGLEWSSGRRYPECLTVRYPRTAVDPADYFHTRMVSAKAAQSAAVLLNALPLIADVVEAAERLNEGDLIYASEEEALDAALTALRDALEEKS